MPGTVEQIKSKLTIVDVVESYLKLERAGGNLKAKCPFHKEKTPSFFVSPARESFHCFGCSKGGDIFEFVKEMEGVEFVDALKILAERAGVKIVREDNIIKSQRGRLISTMESAVVFFQKELLKNPQAIEYLTKRGLNQKTIESWRIGFAPDSWRALYDYLTGLGFSDLEIEKAGLIVKSPKGYYDRFRGRIMFPLNNVSGTPVGFSGRIMPGNSDQNAAKYINSPQTELYDKSKILFGFDRARVGIRTSNTCVLVEGQMDLIMSHQSGNLNTAAVSGTALTEEHLKNIGRLAGRLILAFDGDDAGFKASHRGIDIALATGMDVRIALLPNKIDPADLILEDGEKWTNLLSGAKHVIDFYLEILESKHKEPRELKIQVERLVLPYVSKIKSSIEQAHFVNLIAGKLSIDEAPIWDTLKKIGISEGDISKKSEDILSEKVSISDDSRINSIFKKIVGILLWQNELEPGRKDFSQREVDLRTILGEERYGSMQKIVGDKKDGLIFEAEISLSGGRDVLVYLDDLILNFREEGLREGLNNTVLKLKKAESLGDQNEVLQCLSLCQKFYKELASIKNDEK